jgi:Predicted phage phi-C31 gp36 major capsid-like protein
VGTKMIIPTDSAGIMELLSDHERLSEAFSQEAVGNGTTKKFMDAYAKDYLKRNPDTVDDVRDQVQSVLFDMIRSDGSKRGPKLGVTAGNGQPQLTVDGEAMVSRGRGAVYNKTAAGAQLERAYKPADRLNSIGEYCKAIFELRSPSTRPDRDALLAKLSNVKEFQNSFSSEEPGAGGFLIPEIMRSELLQLALEKSIVRTRATVIPMSTLRVPIPTVDDTSHVSSIFGGVVFYWTEEAAALTESAATFGKVVLDAKKLTGFFKVPAELLADAPAFGAWFDERVPMGFAWSEDVAFMTETGDGTPLGFISCPASVAVTAESGQPTATILWENIVNMYSRMLPTSLSNAVWICSHDTFPQLATMALSVGTGGGPGGIGGWSQPGSDMPPMTILGRPVIFTEKVPKLGTTGDISFVDLSYYLIGDRQQVRVDSSEHFLFANNQVAYRIISRVDGRPWLQSALTPHNNSSSTLSPFVQIATR